MKISMSENYIIALREKKPIVALETAVVTHGFPRPLNLETALAMEEAVAATGAVPCTIGVLDGAVILGMSIAQLKTLSQQNSEKVGIRELPLVLARSRSGGTTVAATAYLAHRYGIHVFATGGIGGVHRGAANTFDISGDLIILGRTPITVVASGAKAILDLQRTLEYLETAGVTVAGFNTAFFPAFYASNSPYSISVRLTSPLEAAQVALARDDLGLSSALLVCNPVASSAQIPYDELMLWIDAVQKEIEFAGITGQDVTPAMLKRLSQLSGGRTLEANTSLLIANASLAGEIACELAVEREKDIKLLTQKTDE